MGSAHHLSESGRGQLEVVGALVGLGDDHGEDTQYREGRDSEEYLQEGESAASGMCARDIHRLFDAADKVIDREDDGQCEADDAHPDDDEHDRFEHDREVLRGRVYPALVVFAELQERLGQDA